MMKRYAIALGLLCSLVLALPSQGFAAPLSVKKAQRRVQAHTVKSTVATYDEAQKPCDQQRNGDEWRYCDLRGSYGKALQHKCNGFLLPAAFDSMVHALNKGSQRSFNHILLGGDRKLINPQASFAFSLAGNDGWVNCIPPAPAFASVETSAEMVELYWAALTRDVPFNHFHLDETVKQAVCELNRIKGFTGPRIKGRVTPHTFLRDNPEGNLEGPYISQFLYQTMPFGSLTMPPYSKVPLPGKENDFMTNFASWFKIVNGGPVTDKISYDPEVHFLRNTRDLGEYVHKDTPIQAGLTAAMILLSYGKEALDKSNPYFDNCTQDGFVTFGIVDVEALLAKAMEEAFKAAWFQKWQVHRRVRPEEYGFYVHEQLSQGVCLDIPKQLLNSRALQETFNTFNSYFLPIAYPEGCPTHPSYPSGHATAIGAMVTILKAFFDEEFIIPNPLQPNLTNTALEPHVGVPLRVGGELNKLAGNIALGRNGAGVHYRSDAAAGLLLGEKVAINVLQNDGFLFHENFKGYCLTTFSGERIRVGGKRPVD